MLKIQYIAVLLGLVFFDPFSGPLLANQEKSEPPISAEEYKHFEDVMNIELFKLETAKAIAGAKLVEKNVKHRIALMKDVEESLAAQSTQTFYIAVMIHGMVLLALYLSYLQFKDDIKNRSGGGKGSEKVTTFKVGKDGIEFSSSVIGLAILFLSFWFFSVYVDKVYDIEVNFIP